MSVRLNFFQYPHQQTYVCVAHLDSEFAKIFQQYVQNGYLRKFRPAKFKHYMVLLTVFE